MECGGDMKRRYAWIGNGDCWRVKTFSSYKEMVEWAKNSEHEGIYYISCPDITFKKTREQILKG